MLKNILPSVLSSGMVLNCLMSLECLYTLYGTPLGPGAHSAKNYELFPEDSSHLCQWLAFLLTVHLVLLLEISQLLLQLLYLGGHAVLVVGLIVVPCFEVAKSL